MKCSEDWLAKGGKQPSKDDITERTQPMIPDRLTTVLGVASLVSISVTSAVLGILWDGPKKSVSLKADATQLHAQYEQQNVVGVESKPATAEAPAGSHSGYPSTIPTQDVVRTGLPGSMDQTSPLTTEPTLGRLRAESDARDPRHLSATRPHGEAASPHTKKRQRRPDSSFAAIGRALGFRIARWLNKL